MGNFVRFTDSVKLVTCNVSEKVKDYYNKAAKEGLKEVKPLKIRIAATHSGKITRNNGFYLPDKMEKGASSFTDQFSKPLLVHHKEKEDPIGRVVESKYVDFSESIRDRFSDSLDEKTSTLLDAFISGELDFDDSFQFATDYLINDKKITSNLDFEGLGYIEIVASITDPEAIQKILDGRYITGSVGASTNQAICSICKQDWASKGKCKHRPGKVYHNKKCVIIAGDLIYDEYSFVNKPADLHSRIIEINIDGIQDFVSLDSEEMEITLIHDKENSREEYSMIFKDAFELVSKNKRFKGREKLEENVKKLIDAHEEIDEEKLFQLLDEVYKVEDKSEDSVDVEDETKSEEDQEGMSATQIAKAIEDAVALALEKQQKALDEREEKSNKLEDAINEAKVEANKEIEELTKRLDASRKEIRYLHSDIESLTLEIANKVSEARKARVNHITDMRRLSGEDVDFSKVSDELKEKSGEEILVALSDASNKVDTQKIIDTLSSGLTNDPNASVSNPTLIDDNIKTRSVRKLTDTEKEQVRTQWLKINITSGNEIADNWLNDTCKNLGISTEEFTSEKK